MKLKYLLTAGHPGITWDGTTVSFKSAVGAERTAEELNRLDKELEAIMARPEFNAVFTRAARANGGWEAVEISGKTYYAFDPTRLEILGTTQNGASAVRLDGVVYHSISSRLSEMIDSQRKALDGTSYQVGVINGLITVEAVVNGTDPKLVEAKPPKRRGEPRSVHGQLRDALQKGYHLEVEVTQLRTCLQEVADHCLSTSLRARDKIKEIEQSLARSTAPIRIDSKDMVASIKCDIERTRGETIRIGAHPDHGVSLGTDQVEHNPFVDTITERELAFALNCNNIDSIVGAPDFELARDLFRRVLENRGKHPSLMNSYFEQNSGGDVYAYEDAPVGGGDALQVEFSDGKPEPSAADVFQRGNACEILEYLTSIIKDTVLGCALKHGAQPVPPQELRLWSEYGLRDVIRQEIKEQSLPGGSLS